MADKKGKRCEYCGGTMWLDGDIVKCFMCSRPAKSEDAETIPLTRWGQPKLPGTQARSGYRRDK